MASTMKTLVAKRSYVIAAVGMALLVGVADGPQGAFLPGCPRGRIGTSEEIAAATVDLASDECFVTGLTLRRSPTQEEIGACVARAMAGGEHKA